MSASATFELANGNFEDAHEARRSIYGKGDATRADLDNLIACAARPEFAELLAEVAVDVLVRQVDPEGYVTERDAAWLVSRLSGDGVPCRAEFEMLKAVLGHAVSVPPALTAFAVREVERAILTGRRDATGGVDHEAGVVTRDDVDALRAMVFAPTRGSSPHVDRATAEALFDIAHATATARNDPGFADFFARAVGNYLMGVAFAGAPDRDEVLRHEAELDRRVGFGAFFAAMARAPTRAEFADTTTDEVEAAFARQNLQTARQLEAAKTIRDDQADWIVAHLTRGGPLTEPETRLLRFLVDEAASTPPRLAELLDAAA